MDLTQKTINYFWEQLKDDKDIQYLLSIDYEYVDPPLFNNLDTETKFVKLCEILKENSAVLERLFNTDHTLLIPHEAAMKNSQVVKRAIVYTLFETKCLGEFLKRYQQGEFALKFPPLLESSLHCFLIETTFQVFTVDPVTKVNSVLFWVSLENFDELILTDAFQNKLQDLPLYFYITSVGRGLTHHYTGKLSSLKSTISRLFIILGLMS